VNVEPQPIEPGAPSASAPAAAGAKAQGGQRALALAACALLLLLTAFTYRGLLTFQPTGSIVVEVEGWFFEPSDTTPAVVALMSLWLLYRRKQRIEALAWEPGSLWVTAPCFALAFGIFCWALATDASDLQAVSLVCLCLGAANLLGGRAALRAVWLPVIFLLFAVPIPSPLRHAIVWKFQIWTADATGFLLYLLRVPSIVSGDRIILADTVFAVIETCSGLRSVITLSMLAVLMIDLFRRSGLHAAALLVFTPLLAFATNALRALGLVLNPKSDIATIHSLQGIGMLLASVLVLYAFDGLLERLGVPGSRSPRTPRRTLPARPSGRRVAAAVGMLVALAVASLSITAWRIPSPDQPLPADLIGSRLGGWHSVDLETDRLFLGMAALTGSVHRRYSRGGESVEVFVAAGSPRMRFRSFYTAKTALPGSGWIIEEQGRAERRGREVDVLVVRKGAERRLIQHWYEHTGGFGEELLRELLALDASPLTRSQRGLVLRVETPLESFQPREKAEARLDEMSDLLLTTLLQDEMRKPSSAPGGK
jgi:exosortase